jgi:hypothetical protein
LSEFKTRTFASRTSGILSALFLASIVVGVDLTDRVIDPASFVPGEPSPVSVRLPMKGYMRLSFAVPVKVEYELEHYIIRAGEPVPDRAAEQYKLLESSLERRADLLVYRSIGLFLIIFLLGFLLSEALRRSWPGVRRYLRTEIAIYTLLTLMVIGAKPVFALTDWPIFIFPATAAPIVVTYFRGRRLGVYVTLIGSFILSSMLDFDPVVMVVFLVQGLSVVPFLRQSRKFRPLVMAAVVATVSGLVTLFGLSLALSGAREILSVTDWRNSVVLSLLAGGFLSGFVGWLLALAIRPVLGIVSQSTLNDLQALQHPLLKRLQSQSPGTWEHSRAIANLAEEAASKIDGDALLVRVGSYFHDLGKAVNPNLFVENQETGEDGKPINAHDGMSPDRSASLIIDHVLQGVQILRNNGIPEAVVEFAYMHHGTSVVEFFFNKYVEQCKSEGIEKPELTRRAFTYPGIPPQTPETGIMMLADAVEATSRTVTDPKLENFTRVVNRIIFSKLSEGQLDDSGLTIRDLKIVGQSFADSLFFSRHKRVKYQWQEREEAEDLKSREAEAESTFPPADEPPPDQASGEVDVPLDEESTPLNVEDVSGGTPSLPPPEPAEPGDDTEDSSSGEISTPSVEVIIDDSPIASPSDDRQTLPRGADSRRITKPHVVGPQVNAPSMSRPTRARDSMEKTLPGVGIAVTDDED